MPITGGDAGDKVVLRIFKHLTTRPDAIWVNNYEFVTDAAWFLEDLAQVATDFMNFEKSFHANVVSFDRWTFSTWAADSKPYNPDNFTSVPFPSGTIGNVDLSGSNELNPLDIVCWVAREVATGRQGKVFYRGAIGEERMTAPSGVAAPQGTALQTQINTALDHVGKYLATNNSMDPDSDFRLALIGKTGTVRRVVNLVLRGVAINKRDRGYFDRV